MHRATWRTLGTVGIGLLAVFLLLGLTVPSVAGSGPAAHGAKASSGATVAAAHPDGTNTWISASISAAPAAYSTLPTWVNFTLAYGNFTGTIGPTNTMAWVNVVDDVSHTTQANVSAAIQSGVLTYSVTLNATTLNCAISDPTCTSTLIDNYELNLFVYLNGTSGGGNVGTNETPEFAVVSFITYAPVFTLVSPVNTGAAEAGNITVSVAYRAQYTTAVQLNIYSASSALVYSSSFFQTQEGISVAKVWYELTPGNYGYSIVAQTPYATIWNNGTIVVTPSTAPSGGGTIYYNTTLYNNVTGGTSPTGFFGLSPAASGTLLLVVGLIVGIIAGMVAARMMMSSPPAKPAQPWTDNKNATNTCSVCGKSFGSADELAAHSKSEHGMQ